MWTRHHKRRNTGRLIVPAVTALVLSYFGFHAYQGEYGLNAKAQLEQRVASLEAELEALRKARGKLEERAGLLSGDMIEQDMLDEQARRALNLSKENEIVIFYRSK
ncbi:MULTISPECIES: FtsB family cell division protein [Chelativorans]|jgi:cell division protein FtsB|uniref:Septum formation initiator n=1 Tax=Chelativorans sp. (strain BNC1) TaxID=266779 RepID=Q11HU9_CHESB|nr:MULTISPECIES: septum formation initiator family protein [Chelativorans]